MSMCISRAGEYSEHVAGDWCPRCGVFNEPAVVTQRDALLAEVERLREDAREFEDNLAALVLAARRGQDKARRKARRRKTERDAARAEVERLRDAPSASTEEVAEMCHSMLPDTHEPLRSKIAEEWADHWLDRFNITQKEDDRD